MEAKKGKEGLPAAIVILTAGPGNRFRTVGPVRRRRKKGQIVTRLFNAHPIRFGEWN